MTDDAQLVFVDTPGIFAPKRRLDRAMVKAAWNGANHADLVLLVIDAGAGITQEVRAIVDQLKNQSSKAFRARTRSTRLPKKKSFAPVKDLLPRNPYRCFMISAIRDGAPRIW